LLKRSRYEIKDFVPARFITSGHSVQKWKGTDMESMRDTKRIMEREIKKVSTPLTFEQMEIDTENYQGEADGGIAVPSQGRKL